MHPEIKENAPGKCPKCGMRLVLKEDVDSNSNYTPLLVIIGLILLTSILISYTSGFSLTKTIYNFMIGFFLIFSGFKLMDLKGFANGYSTYDLLAKKMYGYGYIYPFIELFFGLSMIVKFQMDLILGIEVIVMTFSGVGVAIKLLKGEKFQCACLGTFLKIPLTKITLIEDFGMAILALIILLIR